MAKARTLIIKIVVNKKERDDITRRAKTYGMSLSGFARHMALSGVSLSYEPSKTTGSRP